MKMATGEGQGQPEAVLNGEQIELQQIVRKMPVSDHVFEYAVGVRVTRVTTDGLADVQEVALLGCGSTRD